LRRVKIKQEIQENEKIKTFREALLAQDKADVTAEKYLRIASKYLDKGFFTSIIRDSGDSFL